MYTCANPEIRFVWTMFACAGAGACVFACTQLFACTCACAHACACVCACACACVTPVPCRGSCDDHCQFGMGCLGAFPQGHLRPMLYQIIIFVIIVIINHQSCVVLTFATSVPVVCPHWRAHCWSGPGCCNSSTEHLVRQILFFNHRLGLGLKPAIISHVQI